MGVSIMHFTKKFSFLLTLIFCINSFTFVYANEYEYDTSSIAIYNSIEEWESSGDDSNVVRIKNNDKGKYLGGYVDYVYSKTTFDNDVRIGYHPDFSNWAYWDGYYFSTSKTTPLSATVSLNWGRASVSVNVQKSSSSNGTFKKADGTRKSRPWVRADITTKFYDMYIYDDYGKLIQVVRDYQKVIKSSDVNIFIEHI